MLVVFAIAATALLATIGLLYSVGFVLTERRALQTAADAASLRGAWQIVAELQSDDRLDSNVRATLLGYAASNGVTNPADVSAVYVDGRGTVLSTVVGCGCVFPAEARGVRVTVSGQSANLLPGFVGAAQTVARASATSTGRPTATPSSAVLVVPIGVPASDYSAHGQIELFSSRTRSLDLTSAGASNYGPPMTNNLQFWSDGQHANGSVQSETDLPIVSNAFDAVAIGLRDSVRRQGLTDASGAAYGTFSVPLWSGGSATNVHVVGFARLKIKLSDISSSSARGTFVPYPADAFGTPSTSTPDYGASLVGILS